MRGVGLLKYWLLAWSWDEDMSGSGFGLVASSFVWIRMRIGLDAGFQNAGRVGPRLDIYVSVRWVTCSLSYS